VETLRSIYSTTDSHAMMAIELVTIPLYLFGMHSIKIHDHWQ
jgi:hypothetical protein